jgi:hypothetical protein
MRARLFFTISLATILSGGARCAPRSVRESAALSASRSRSPRPLGSCEIPTTFKWTSTGPLVTAIADEAHPIVSVKDPTVVYFNEQWNIYATTADASGHWSLVYLHFDEWSQAASARPYYMSENPGFGNDYHAAPELFYFTRQHKWYLVYQSGAPTYSTADDPGRPDTWSRPQSFFADEPSIVTSNQGLGGWLDFWVICNTSDCYLFFSDDNGNWYRSRTTVREFPAGFRNTVIVMHDSNGKSLFEGSNVYAIEGTDKYLALVEAIGPTGSRFFRSWVADRLDGQWTALADTWNTPFAGVNNVSFAREADPWTRDVSHGEMIRDGYDETLTIDPCNLRFVYQGVNPTKTNVAYSQLPYQLALLSRAK